MTTRRVTSVPSDESAPFETAATVALGHPTSAKTSRVERAPVAFGLGTKFSAGAALLLVLALGAAVGITSWRAEQVAQVSIRENLGKVPQIFEGYKTSLEAARRDQVRSLAGESGTKAVFDPGISTSTKWEFARDFAQVLGARTVMLFDQTSALQARSDRPEGHGAGQPFGAVRWVSGPLESWREASAVMREGSLLSIVAAAPVITGQGDTARIEGVLAATFPLGIANTKSLQEITRGQIAFLVDTAKRGEKPSVVVSTATEGFEAAAFVAAFGTLPGAIERVFTKGEPFGPFDLTVSGKYRIGLALPLKSASGETYGTFVVTRAVADEMTAFRQIRSTLFLVGGLALLLAVPVAFGLGTRLARPLRVLARGASAIREGNLDVRLPEAGADEVGRLAGAFRAMVVELKEKRSLEQLVYELHHVSGSSAAATLGGGVDGPRVGEVFAARYRIREVLGRGGMGTVYLADDLELEEDVALKVLNAQALADSTQALPTLKQEIRLARRITHPNVVRVHDLGEIQGRYFLTMEHVAGLTLRQVLDQQGPLALAPGLQIAKQLCRGLAAVHEAGIVHRDIKPQNVMVLSGGVVKLMDFGIAWSHQGSGATPDSVAGTPYYMSPEQARGLPLDGRSDVYSVGAALFEVFTGERPFEGKMQEVIEKHLREEPPRPAHRRPDLPDVLDRLIVACLAKEPTRRPASARDLYVALMAIQLPEV